MNRSITILFILAASHFFAAIYFCSTAPSNMHPEFALGLGMVSAALLYGVQWKQACSDAISHKLTILGWVFLFGVMVIAYAFVAIMFATLPDSSVDPRLKIIDNEVAGVIAGIIPIFVSFTHRVLVNHSTAVFSYDTDQE